MRCCSPLKVPVSSSTTVRADGTVRATAGRGGRRRDPRRRGRGDRAAQRRRRLGGCPHAGRDGDRGLRRRRHPRQQRRHPPRSPRRQHDRGRVGRRDPCPPARALLSDPPRRRLLARRAQGRAGLRPATSSTRRRRPGLLANPGQSNYGAAKSGIATFTQIVAKELSRVRRQGQLHRPGGPHAAHAGDPGPRRHHGRPRRDVRRVGPRPTWPRSSPTWRRRRAGSTARRSSCAAARCSGCARGSSPRACAASGAWSVDELADALEPDVSADSCRSPPLSIRPPRSSASCGRRPPASSSTERSERAQRATRVRSKLTP